MASSLVGPRPPLPGSDDVPRPAPKRTYGRARPASPPRDTADRPDLFFGGSSASSRTVESPSKTLLDRFTGNSALWVKSFGNDEWDKSASSSGPEEDANSDDDDLSTERAQATRGRLYPTVKETSDHQAAPVTQEEEDEVDLDSVKRKMAELRAQSRGGIVADIEDEATVPMVSNLAEPARMLRPSFSSSSLTEAPPTSQHVASPTVPRVPLVAVDSLAPRAIAAASSSSSLSAPPPISQRTASPTLQPAPIFADDALAPRALAAASSSSSLSAAPPTSQRTASPTLQRVPIAADDALAPRGLVAASSASSLSALPFNFPDSSPPARQSPAIIPLQPRSSLTDVESMPIRRHTGKTVIQSEDESDPAAPSSPSPSPTRRRLGRTSIHDSDTEADDERDALPSLLSLRRPDQRELSPVAGTSAAALSVPVIFNEVEGMFDDMEKSAKGSRNNHGIKRPTQKDIEQTKKDVAAAKRNTIAFPNKPLLKRRPLTTFISEAQKMLWTPGQSRADSSATASSPVVQTLTDPIVDASSPESTSAKLRQRIAMNLHEGEADELPSLTEAMEKLDKEKRQKRLDEKKALAMKDAEKQRGRGAQTRTDDDFEVSPQKPKAVMSVKFKAGVPTRRGPDAQAVLKMSASTTSPQMTRNRQAYLNRAGKPGKPPSARSLQTETYVDFAARNFDHANMRNANNGAKPAGLKQGRDRPLPQAVLDRQLREDHERQARAQRSKKEEEYGRVKALPEKAPLDTKPLLEMASHVAPVPEEEDEDEEEEDEEFVPSGEEDERDAFSGDDEDEIEPTAEQHQEEVLMEESIDDVDKENTQPLGAAVEATDEEDGTPIFKMPKRKAAARRIDSDDEREESTPRHKGANHLASVPRTPLEEMQAFQQPYKTPTPGNAMVFGGFGSGASPGFSQLFGETQAGGSDGFAGLRAPPAFGLLTGVAALPDVNISATQAERDNALIAAELEHAQVGNISPTNEQPKYLNDQGFFTQTKPSAPQASLTQVYDDENGSVRRHSALAGSSMTSLLGEHRASVVSFAETPSATVKNTAPEPLVGSPTQVDGSLRRLKRRASPDAAPPSSIARSPSPAYESAAEPVLAAPVNAFTLLMQRQAPVEEARPVRSNFVDEQAEESDEDAGWIPRTGNEEDDNEEGNDEGFVADLVDDQQVDEAERQRQDAAAAEKARLDQILDDEKREQDAKKVTRGDLRKNRNKRGEEFVSDDDDSDDEDGHKRKRSKKRKRKVDNDGLEKLEGEETEVFKKVYDKDLESDEDDGMDVRDEHVDLEDDGATLPMDHRSQQEQIRSVRDMIRKRARKNAEVDPDNESVDLDREIGFDGAGFSIETEIATPHGSDEESQDSSLHAARSLPTMRAAEQEYSVSRSIRSSATLTDLARSQDAADPPAGFAIVSHSSFSARSDGSTVFGRKTESYAQYVQDESQVTRRAAGAPAGVSVVNSRGGRPMRPPLDPRMRGMNSSQSGGKAPARETSSTSSAGSILASKGGKFV